MAYSRLCIFFALSFVARSLQINPITDFCRRWGHQTAQVNGRLYIDGGQVAYNNLQKNYTNEWLIYSDLNSRSDAGFPIQSNLSKPTNITSLSGGYLWADELNKCFYQFGGEFPEGDSPKDFSISTYDVILNQWNSTSYKSSDPTLKRPSYGAGTQVESRGFGFYYGGWVSNRTTPGWKGAPTALSSIMQFDFTTGLLRNSTHPDGIGRAEGQMLYLPVSDNGMLVYLGGIEDPYHNGSYNAASMSKVQIYDINSGKWYSQTTTGDAPLPRRQFCAGVTWPSDRSSFNIYLYGGYGFGTPAAFDDVYILSLPSFKWIKGYPLDGSDTSLNGHGGCSANVVNPDQMVVIGGWFPNSTSGACDGPDTQGQHNMILGNNSGKADSGNGIWDKYDPKLTTYVVPDLVVSAIGGGPTGGATVTAPLTWDHSDLKVYYKLSPPSASRTATRVLTATASPSNQASPAKKHVGAIAGGVVGGLLGLAAVLGLVLFCLHRLKKTRKDGGGKDTPAPPVELAVTSISHELSAGGTNKYLSTQERPYADDHSHYAELAPLHSRNGSYGQTSSQTASPLHSHHSTSSAPTAPYSPYKTEPNHQSSYPPQHSPYRGETLSSEYNASHNAQEDSWGQQGNSQYVEQASQRQYYDHPSQVSPQSANADMQQQPQIYYPPPPDSSHGPHPAPPFPGQRSSPAGASYSNDSQYGRPPDISTTTTPAHFYAQPKPARNY